MNVGIKELIKSCFLMLCEEGQYHVKMPNMVHDGVCNQGKCGKKI